MKRLHLFLLFLFIFIVGCTSTRKLYHTGHSHKTDEQTIRSSIAEKANMFVGAKYRYGGLDNKGFDCSGLVYSVYRDHAITLPRSSRDQMNLGKNISPKSAKVGDLIFFRQKGKINHVAIITGIRAGDIWVTHSTTSRGVVREKLFESPYWTSRIEEVRDVISGLAAK